MSRLTSRKFLLAAAAVLYFAAHIVGGAVPVAEGMDRIRDVVVAYLAVEGAGDAAARIGTGGA